MRCSEDILPGPGNTYDYALDGLDCMRISKKLMEEKVPVTHVKSNTERQENYYYWAGSRISHILRNPFYKGAHLVCRTHQKGIRSIPMTLSPVRNGRSLRAAMRRL